ncbi:MAG: hypothetical protein MPF33_07060 [Candidatus Aramenus sp.]|jgi:hypothetical protein|nr:hypothetical protein [Candidatus Aramenus sp.]
MTDVKWNCTALAIDIYTSNANCITLYLETTYNNVSVFVNGQPLNVQ